MLLSVLLSIGPYGADTVSLLSGNVSEMLAVLFSQLISIQDETSISFTPNIGGSQAFSKFKVIYDFIFLK